MPALDNWECFFHERDVLPDLIQCAVMHEQFEAIHPFWMAIDEWEDSSSRYF